MRIAFIGFMLCLSLFFLIYGLRYEYVSSGGQVGPGFFPFWLGLLLVVTTSIALIKDLRNYLKEKPKMQISDNVKTFLIILGLTIIFIVLLKVIGAIISMVLYMFAILYFLNRDRLLFNSILSISLSAACYLLLDVWLNAGLPEGIFGF